MRNLQNLLTKKKGLEDYFLDYTIIWGISSIQVHEQTSFYQFDRFLLDFRVLYFYLQFFDTKVSGIREELVFVLRAMEI